MDRQKENHNFFFVNKNILFLGCFPFSPWEIKTIQTKTIPSFFFFFFFLLPKNSIKLFIVIRMVCVAVVNQRKKRKKKRERLREKVSFLLFSCCCPSLFLFHLYTFPSKRDCGDQFSFFYLNPWLFLIVIMKIRNRPFLPKSVQQPSFFFFIFPKIG